MFAWSLSCVCLCFSLLDDFHRNSCLALFQVSAVAAQPDRRCRGSVSCSMIAETVCMCQHRWVVGSKIASTQNMGSTVDARKEKGRSEFTKRGWSKGMNAPEIGDPHELDAADLDHPQKEPNKGMACPRGHRRARTLTSGSFRTSKGNSESENNLFTQTFATSLDR